MPVLFDRPWGSCGVIHIDFAGVVTSPKVVANANKRADFVETDRDHAKADVVLL